MSLISTSSINNNFPLPGVNNSSQGFRSNFSAIKTNINIASDEITELQNKSIVKSALLSGPINNDMSNTLITNALTLGFRGTTFNLGDNLQGKVTVNLVNGDAQYGIMSGDIFLNFSGWAPNNTQSSVQVILSVNDPFSQYTITLPSSVNNGTTTLENYNGSGDGGTVTVPPGVSKLHFNFTTIDSGINVEIQPLNRPRITGTGPTVAGTNNQVQYNKSGSFGANENFVFDYTNNKLTLGAELIPKTTTTYNLGSNTKAWKDVYLSGSSIYIGAAKITASSDGTINLSANPSVVLPIATPTATGKEGDVTGIMCVDSSYIYVCTGNYDGTTAIWKKTALSSY